ncbi:MAG: HAD family hydrolase, partial [Planctomycetes bacterium]|nr:HAD family hydrolase [Planctomycetota bacterium]
MAKTLPEYMDWLDGRNLVWPRPPKAVAVKATPSVKPLRGIKAVTWSVYGTLLRISDGRLLLDHPQELRMQVALEKTLCEFNMWQSMTRKPGEPWKQISQQYKSLLEKARLSATPALGDKPEIDTRKTWRSIVDRLGEKKY